MNYLERLSIEIESRKSQLKTLQEMKADYACGEIAKEIDDLIKEYNRYTAYEASKVHHIYVKTNH